MITYEDEYYSNGFIEMNRPANINDDACTTGGTLKRKAIDMPELECKSAKMRATLSAKCREPRVKPGKEETIDPNDISTDDEDEEDPSGKPIPIQIGNRPGPAKPQYKRQLSIIEGDYNESEVGFTA